SDGNGSHASTLKSPSYTKSVSWQHYQVTGHGFRHTMSTILHEEGFNAAWIETQLAHVDKNAIRGTYNHALYLEGRKEMMQWYGDYVDSCESNN
ncbi:tyrosine-type recombinase/integrase, partial [Klebsiella pneumoniae subsp. pneumoniae]